MKNFLGMMMAVLAILGCKEQKTAYVDSSKVVSEFYEMKEAEAFWTQKNNALRKDLEQKAIDFQKEVQEFERTSKSLSKSKYEARASALRVKQQNLQREQQSKVKEIQENSGAAIDVIVKKVKEFIQDYGKSNGYTYIFGNTEASNILYGKEELDITQELLNLLNKEQPSEKIQQERPEDTISAKK